MEVKQLRIAALPVLIALFAFFALSVAASSGLSGAKLWSVASKDLLSSGLSLKFSKHGLLTDISTKQPLVAAKPKPVVTQAQNIASGVRSSLISQQLELSAASVR